MRWIQYFRGGSAQPAGGCAGADGGPGSRREAPAVREIATEEEWRSEAERAGGAYLLFKHSTT